MHLKSFNFIKNQKCALWCDAPNVWIFGCAFSSRTNFMWQTVLLLLLLVMLFC